MPFALRPGPAPAVTALVRLGADFTLHPYDVGELDDGADLAELLDVEEDRVLETLIVDAAGRLVACTLPAGWDFDEGAAAAALGVPRVRRASETVTERATGHLAEAMSPFGHRRRLPALVDRGVVDLAGALPGVTVFVASGQLGLEVEVGLADLLRLTGATPADLAVDGA